MKTCEACGKEILARRPTAKHPDGPSALAARKFCSRTCKIAAEKNKGSQLAQSRCRICERCGREMHPRCFPSGRREEQRVFLARRFCSRECADPGWKLHEISDAKWTELYWGAAGGYPSLRQLGDRFGVGADVIGAALRRHGIRVRSKQEQWRLDYRHGRRPRPTGNPLAYQNLANADPGWKQAGERARRLKIWERSNAVRAELAAETRLCCWCLQPIVAIRSRFSGRSRWYCGRSCLGKATNFHRYHPDAPRPLFVACLLARVKENPHRRPIRENLEDLAQEIGATEDEVIEALLEASDG